MHYPYPLTINQTLTLISISLTRSIYPYSQYLHQHGEGVDRKIRRQSQIRGSCHLAPYPHMDPYPNRTWTLTLMEHCPNRTCTSAILVVASPLRHVTVRVRG